MVITDVVNSLPTDVQFRSQRHIQSMVLLSVGLNDIRSIGSPERHTATIEAFEERVERLLSLALGITSTVVFVGYTPVNEEFAAPRFSQTVGQDVYFFNERIELFDEACQKLCESTGVHYVSLFQEATALHWNDYVIPDGLHPNDKGYEWIFTKVWPVVEEWMKN